MSSHGTDLFHHKLSVFIQNMLIWVLISKFKAKFLVLYISVLIREVLNQEFTIGFSMFRTPKPAHSIVCVICWCPFFLGRESRAFIRFSKGPMTPKDPPLHSGLCSRLQAELWEGHLQKGGTWKLISLCPPQFNWNSLS